MKNIEKFNKIISKQLLIYFTVAASLEITSNSTLTLKYLNLNEMEALGNIVISTLVLLAYPISLLAVWITN